MEGFLDGSICRLNWEKTPQPLFLYPIFPEGVMFHCLFQRHQDPTRIGNFFFDAEKCFLLPFFFSLRQYFQEDDLSVGLNFSSEGQGRKSRYEEKASFSTCFRSTYVRILFFFCWLPTFKMKRDLIANLSLRRRVKSLLLCLLISREYFWRILLQ